MCKYFTVFLYPYLLQILIYSIFMISLSGFGIEEYWPHKMSWVIVTALLFWGNSL